jgi:hypothetical protein
MSAQHEPEKIGADHPKVGTAKAAAADYTVGRGKPPKEYTWKKGRSGNPTGRPQKKSDKKSIIEEIMNEPIVMREDGKERKITKYAALFRSHLAKGIKGDTRSARLVLEEAASLDLGVENDDDILVPVPPKISPVQSEALFENLDPNVLSDDDKVALARFGRAIDLGGDFTALSIADFARAKQITDKGRGKNVTPTA